MGPADLQRTGEPAGGVLANGGCSSPLWLLLLPTDQHRPVLSSVGRDACSASGIEVNQDYSAGDFSGPEDQTHQKGHRGDGSLMKQETWQNWQPHKSHIFG